MIELFDSTLVIALMLLAFFALLSLCALAVHLITPKAFPCFVWQGEIVLTNPERLQLWRERYADHRKISI